MEAKSEVEVKNRDAETHSLFLHNPCTYFQEFMRAVLNCLGFNSGPPDSPSIVDDPPSSAADPPADPPPVAAELRVAPPRPPPRPPVSGGRGAQTNANPN